MSDQCQTRPIVTRVHAPRQVGFPVLAAIGAFGPLIAFGLAYWFLAMRMGTYTLFWAVALGQRAGVPCLQNHLLTNRDQLCSRVRHNATDPVRRQRRRLLVYALPATRDNAGIAPEAISVAEPKPAGVLLARTAADLPLPADDRHLCDGLHGPSWLGVDVKVILTPPCIFCMENH